MSTRPNPAGGHFLETVDITWDVGDEVSYLNYTLNGTQPTISKYIAYDTLNPPNPFIAVTQDGRGNVVYDGGFPKLYNGSSPPVGTTFEAMTASYKYFYNAINFVSNQSKVDLGVRKLLVVGDSNSNESYSVGSASGNGFLTSFTRLAAATGYELTVKTRSAWAGGSIDPTLEELEAYNLVIFMSSRSGGWNTITPAAINNFITYRENGNGLIFITDHGPVLNTIEQATANTGGFFACANRIIVNFGAWFGGNFDRTPVKVGHIRNTYGDHPLYNGMTDTESISAGGSESRVYVAEYIPYTKETVPNITLSDPGVYTISVLALNKDGSMVSQRYVYTLLGGSVYRYLDEDGLEATVTKATLEPMVRFSVDVTMSNVGTMRGGVFKNGLQVGLYDYNGLTSTITWFAGNGETVAVSSDDVIEVRILTPFTYAKPLIAQRVDGDLSDLLTVAQNNRELFDNGFTQTVPGSIERVRAFMAGELPGMDFRPDLSSGVVMMKLRRYFSNQWALPPTTAYIYPNDVELEQGLLTLPRNAVGISGASGLVMFYQNERWRVATDVGPEDFLGHPRTVTSLFDGVEYHLTRDGIQ